MDGRVVSHSSWFNRQLKQPLGEDADAGNLESHFLPSKELTFPFPDLVHYIEFAGGKLQRDAAREKSIKKWYTEGNKEYRKFEDDIKTGRYDTTQTESSDSDSPPSASHVPEKRRAI